MAERGVKSVLEETPSTWRWSTRHHVVGAESRERGWWLTPAASSHQDEGLSTLPAAGGGMPALLGNGRTALGFLKAPTGAVLQVQLCHT